MSKIATSTKAELSLAWQVSLLVLLSVIVIMTPDLALATAADVPMGNILCRVKDWFTGNLGKGLATIAITVIGIGALLGKVSWGMAMIVGVGIAIIFGAAGIVTALNVSGLDNTCSTTASWS